VGLYIIWHRAIFPGPEYNFEYMEIKPGKQGFLRSYANVRIDSFEEMYSLGGAAPLFSKEGQRWHTYVSNNLLPFGGPFPENFPATLKMPDSVLAKVAGKLMLRGSDARPAFHEAKMHMIEQITDYFTQDTVSSELEPATE
jgi:hypothetical protein